MTQSTTQSVTAWHYTHAKHLPSIMADGMLRAHDHHFISPASPLGTRTPDRPQLWFTLNTFWEPSILPALRPALKETADAETFAYVLEASRASGGSWVRFGIPADVLFPVHWTYPGLVSDPQETQKIVKDWRVSFKDVSIEKCKIESMHTDLQWTRIHTPKQVWLH